MVYLVLKMCCRSKTRRIQAKSDFIQDMTNISPNWHESLEGSLEISKKARSIQTCKEGEGFHSHLDIGENLQYIS